MRKKYSEIDWNLFVDARNFLTHVYQRVNVQRLWKIVKKDMPILEKQIKEMMNDFS